MNEQIDNLDNRMARIETDIRELRTLVIEALKGETAQDRVFAGRR